MKGEIKGVQYLRGIAVLAVVIDHVAGMAAFPKYFGKEWLNGFLSYGASGVDLFFLISGFIICMISLSPQGLQARVGTREFIKRRFIRIIPLMWLCIISYAILRMAGRSVDLEWGNYLRALFLVPTGEVAPAQIWTLRHEFIFYLLFAVSFLGQRRRVWIILIWTISPILMFVVRLAWPFKVGDFWHIIFNPVNLEFASGIAIGLLWLKKTKGYVLDFKINPICVFLLLFLLLMYISYAGHFDNRNLQSVLVAIPVCALILFLGIHVRCGNGWLDNGAELLGNASYSIYLFHPLFTSAILGLWSKVSPETPVCIVVLVVAIIVTVLGILIHKWVERPLIAKTRELLNG